MLKQVSDLIGNNLARRLAFEAPQAEILSYGMQIALETVIKISCLFLIAFMLRLEISTLLVFLAYGSIRTIGGGAHLSTYPRCLTVGCAMLIGSSALSTIPLNPIGQLIFYFITAVLAVICIVLWVPAGTEKKRVINPGIRLQQKTRLALLLILWAIVIVFLHLSKYQIYEQAALYGALNAFLIITPWGYGFFRTLDHTLDQMMKGGAGE